MTTSFVETLAYLLADRVIEQYGPDARLAQIEAMANEWPEVQNLDDGEIEELFEEIRDEIAARGNGRRR